MFHLANRFVSRYNLRLSDTNNRVSSLIVYRMCYRLAVLWLVILLIAGCGRRSEDDHKLTVTREGRGNKLNNPSKKLVRGLLRDPAAAANVSHVWLMNIDLADPDWSHLKELSKLGGVTEFSFYVTQHTDAFVETIPAREQLKLLAFYETDLSDAGLGHLAQVSGLAELRIDFAGGGISTAGLSKLAGITGLKKLQLVSDKKLDAKKLKSLFPNSEIITEHVPAGLWD